MAALANNAASWNGSSGGIAYDTAGPPRDLRARVCESVRRSSSSSESAERSAAACMIRGDLRSGASATGDLLLLLIDATGDVMLDDEVVGVFLVIWTLGLKQSPSSSMCTS